MDKQIEELLSIICTEVFPLSSNESQISFRIAPKRDARTVYDVLNTFGFEAKIYDESDHCRLYLNRSTFQGAEARLDAAFLYAECLSDIAETLDNLMLSGSSQVSDFSINMMNLPNSGKRITISLEPSTKTAVTGTITTTQSSAERPQRMAQRQQRRRTASKPEVTVENMGMPKMAKTYLMQDGPNKGKEKGAHWRWLYTHVFRHFFENSAPAIALIFIIFIVTAVFSTMKGFICPDLAVELNKRPWYCDADKVRSKLRGDDIYIPKGR